MNKKKLADSNRKESIRLVLGYVKKRFETLRNDVLNADFQPNTETLLPAMDILGNLRFILDWVAHDINKFILKRNIRDRLIQKSIYFPCGKSELNSICAIERQFPGLKKKNKHVYELVLSIQPFKMRERSKENTIPILKKHGIPVEEVDDAEFNDNWLVDLNDLINIYKHRNILSIKIERFPMYSLERQDHEDPHIPISELIHSYGEDLAPHRRVSGIHEGYDMHNDDRGHESPYPGLSKTEFLYIQFEDISINIFELIRKSINEITSFTERIYQQIEL